MTKLLYFNIENFDNELSNYLKFYSAVYVTAMCPVCLNVAGYTSGIYVTVKGD
jgi:hypothetical protein